MNVEIRKVANGYMVLPERYDRHGDLNRTNDTDIFIFRDYNQLTDKLKEILEMPLEHCK